MVLGLFEFPERFRGVARLLPAVLVRGALRDVHRDRGEDEPERRADQAATEENGPKGVRLRGDGGIER